MGKRTEKANESERLAEARLAVGAILGFYRRIHRLRQNKLAKTADITKSSMAMFEAGKRLPSVETIGSLSRALNLNFFQRRQLEMLADYPKHPGSAGHEWFLPDDVISGVPMFLRDLKKETVFQTKADIREMWIVTSKPLALDGEMYHMLSERLYARKTSFVYFIDSTTGQSTFQALWRKLLSETRHRSRDLCPNLKCVMTPASFCLYHFGICNPSDDFGTMFGRSIIYAGGVPVGFAAMDAQQVNRAYTLLKPIYQQCVLDPGHKIKTAYGEFFLIEPNLKISTHTRRLKKTA